jgi:hypothetical protein
MTTRFDVRRRGAAALLALGALVAAPAARADYQQAQEILESGTLGGTRGLRVRQIGAGSAAFSKNGSFVYYPASSLKILEHYYAMTLVHAGIWSFGGTTTSVCSGEDDNCGTALNATVASCAAVATPLEDTLETMMENSSNRATNAVQERVGLTFFPPVNPFIFNMAGQGRLVMNGFAGAIGLTDTAVNHKFGCAGFCGNPSPNKLTLVDAERLYKSIATDNARLTPAERMQLHDLMLNESGSFLDDVVEEEAAATGRGPWKDAFLDQLFQIYKSGSWSCSGKKYLSSSGLLQLPTYNGAHKRLYTWGVFAHDTEGEFYLDGTLGAASRELLRLSIRAALLTWGFDYAAAGQVGQVGQAVGQWGDDAGESPAAPSMTAAAAALQTAASILEGEPRDYAAAFAALRNAVDRLETARRLDKRVPADFLRRVLAHADQAAVDLEALASTSEATVLGEAVAAMEAGIRRGRALAAQGSFGAAIREYVAVAGRGNPLVPWGDRGPASSNPDVGFTGVPAPSLESSRVSVGAGDIE